MKILRGIEKLAVDANPMLSAVIGGKARNVFLSEKTVFYTTSFNFMEVQRYLPHFSREKGIPAGDIYLALSTLPVNVCIEDFYRTRLHQAERLIGKRDPDDRHLLALALRLQCPIWSNDRDFDGLGVQVISTEELLKMLWA